jgi:glucose dehydrogenase
MNKHSMCIGILILLLALCLLAPARFALAQTSLDWPFYGHDLANTRYQNVDQINPTNVANLKVAWIFHTGVLDPKAELEVSPIEVNGTVYITDGHDDVFAVDAVTGSQKRAYMPLTIAG